MISQYFMLHPRAKTSLATLNLHLLQPVVPFQYTQYGIDKSALGFPYSLPNLPQFSTLFVPILAA